MAANAYEKLTGRSLASQQICYLGEESLVIVSGRFVETVIHLRYDDIQATLICPTRLGGVCGLLGALGGIAFLVLGLFQAGSGWMWFWLTLTAMLWCVAGYYMQQLGSARMGVQTAVQLVVLEGVTTLRKARRAEARLARRVEAAQGKLSAEALKAAHQRQREARIAARAEARRHGTLAVSPPGSAQRGVQPPPVPSRPDAVPPPVPVREGVTPPPIRNAPERDSGSSEEARPQ